MSEYFVCLDTCVLFDVFDKIRSKGSEPKGWTALKKLIDANEAKLLVPEITLLEFDKNVREVIDELETEILTVGAAITTDSLKERVGKSLKRWRIETERSLRGVAEKIRDWLTASKPIEFTEAISHSTYKRVIARKFYVIVDPTLPKAERDKLKSQESQWLRDQDCAIVESLIASFNGKIDDRQLAFATTDYKGFGPIKKETAIGSLDETFREGLPPTQLFADLEKLVEFVKAKGTVVSLSEKEREQIEREDAKEAAMRQQIARLQTQLDEVNRVAIIPGNFDPGEGRFEISADGLTITLENSSPFVKKRRVRQEYRQPSIFTASGTGRMRSPGYLVEVPEEPTEPAPESPHPPPEEPPEEPKT